MTTDGAKGRAARTPMAYRRGISTLGCPELSLEQALVLARCHALDAVEVRAVSGSTDVPAVFAATYGGPAVLADRMKVAAVPVVSLDTSLRLADPTAAERAAFLEFLPWAEAGRIPWLRVFDGGDAADPGTLQAMADTVAWWRAEKKANAWTADIMIETHDTLCTARVVKAFLALVPGTAILWDTHHTWRNGGEDPLTTWQAIRSHVVHLHVKDSVSRPTAGHAFTYVRPGEGAFPMARLRGALDGQFAGIVCLEWEKLWHPSLSPIDDALALARRRAWW